MKQPRNTVAKKAIQGLLDESEAALSHSEIQTALNGLCDRVTTYRVLDRLVEEETVHKVVNIDGVVKYARCHACLDSPSHKHTHKHIHFSCVQCKAVTCLENIEPIFRLPKKYTIREVNFTVSGLCPNCS